MRLRINKYRMCSTIMYFDSTLKCTFVHTINDLIYHLKKNIQKKYFIVLFEFFSFFPFL